jgi:hypothetical protein
LKLINLVAAGGKLEKAKTEFIIVDSSAESKIEAAVKDTKRVILYQYAMLTEEHLKRIKYV